MKAQKIDSAEQRIEEYKAQAPERKKKRLTMIAVIIGVIFLGFSFFNFSAKNSARVFLLNGTNKEITIKIDEKDYIVKAQSYEPITIPEGDYVYTSSLDDYSREVEFSNTRTTWERFDNNNFIALNPGARALVWVEEVIYIADGHTVSDEEYAELLGKYLFDEVIDYEGTISYPFTTTPDEIDLDTYSNTGTVTAATLISTRGNYDALEYMYYEDFIDYKWFLESSLLSFDNDPVVITYTDELIKIYQNTENYTELEKFAQDLISDDPSIANHVAYQSIMVFLNGEESLIPEYSELLESHSEDSDYLFLLGRLEETISGSTSNLDKAIKLDPSHLFSNLSLSTIKIGRGEFDNINGYITVIENEKDNFDVLPNYLAQLYQANNQMSKYNEILDEQLLSSPSDIYLLSNKIVPLTIESDTAKLDLYLTSLDDALVDYSLDMADFIKVSIETRAGILMDNPAYIYEEVVDPIYQDDWYFSSTLSLNYLLNNQDLTRANKLIEDQKLELAQELIFELLLLSLEKSDKDSFEIYKELLLESITGDNSYTANLIKQILDGKSVALNQVQRTALSSDSRALLSRYIYKTDQGEQEFLSYSKQMSFMNNEVKVFLENL